MYKWLPLPDNHLQKGEIPASTMTRGWWTQAVLLGAAREGCYTSEARES